MYRLVAPTLFSSSSSSSSSSLSSYRLETFPQQAGRVPQFSCLDPTTTHFALRTSHITDQTILGIKFDPVPLVDPHPITNHHTCLDDITMREIQIYAYNICPIHRCSIKPRSKETPFPAARKKAKPGNKAFGACGRNPARRELKADCKQCIKKDKDKKQAEKEKFNTAVKKELQKKAKVLEQ
ncbi:hypothetical protein N658DRAFT_290787 [Parathielavia hyrcaniae]|uniref:Uncharacterized protein n=1 Tax=Parathielavia hyrcaniae TaxID=113614 RepID=A0AAN6PVJ8_9PEZI|nr:hypothetical protein N658DRAFT_290787 [Parathielavia hyrcaniae]